MPADTLLQPFRRNLTVAPVMIPVGLAPVATVVPAMTNKGITTFLMKNPNPFYVWYAGWVGAESAMPADLRANGHYIAPGETYIGRTQMPTWIAAQADEEPNFPIRDPNNGTWLYQGIRTRLVMIYGSGA
jgi:hypothetical protein